MQGRTGEKRMLVFNWEQLALSSSHSVAILWAAHTLYTANTETDTSKKDFPYKKHLNHTWRHLSLHGAQRMLWWLKYMKSDPHHPGSAVMLHITPRAELWEGHQLLWALYFEFQSSVSSYRVVYKMEGIVSHTLHQMNSQKAITFVKLIDSCRFLRVRATKDDIGELKRRREGTCETPLAAPLQAPVLLVWTPGREIF